MGSNACAHKHTRGVDALKSRHSPSLESVSKILSSTLLVFQHPCLKRTFIHHSGMKNIDLPLEIRKETKNECIDIKEIDHEGGESVEKGEKKKE